MILEGCSCELSDALPQDLGPFVESKMGIVASLTEF